MKLNEMLGLTQGELEVYFTNCVLQAKGRAQDTVPIDTGNMRYHAFKNKKTGYYSHRVYFDLGSATKKHTEGKLDGIAPYAKWTNEHPCRVQGWFDNKTVQTFTEELARAVTYMLMEAGIPFDSVDIIQREEETEWNSSNT